VLEKGVTILRGRINKGRNETTSVSKRQLLAHLDKTWLVGCSVIVRRVFLGSSGHRNEMKSGGRISAGSPARIMAAVI
jgi:hypothetical protein